MEPTTREINRLRRCINDLVSILALPAIWTGHDSSRVANTLLDVLVRMLDLDFGYVRASDVGDGLPKEWIRSAYAGADFQTNEIGRALAPYLTDDSAQAGLRIANPAGDGTASIAVLRLGTQDSVGVFVAGSRRSDFPTETERVLLQVATTQAAIALQEARRIAQRDASVEIERTRTKAALQESEERVQQMADSIPEMIQLIIDSTPAHIHTALPDGYIDFFNQTWLKYVGLPLENVEGWKWTAAIHPADVEGIVERWRASLASGEDFLHEARVRRADGEYRWMLHHKVAFRDEQGRIVKWYGSSIDIEERKQVEEKLQQSEKELRQILDLAPQHVGVLEADGRRIYLNKPALDYYGLTLAEWQTDGYKFIHPDDRERLLIEERRSKFPSEVPHEVEARLRRKDGKYRWFIFRRNPLRDDEGRITHWYVALIDIEERRQAEERLQHENIALREEIDKASMFEEIVGDSPPLREVLSAVSKVAPTDSTVLITGETGTGKELVARAIHRRSQRSARAFVSVNCAAIPPSLVASELFGHEKGAFTGAVQRRQGRFELAEGGTIFLDEVGELPPEIQIALLRILQEREFERVGGNRPISVNVRVIAATNGDLETAVKDRSFRADLFYRLNVFPLEVPPLRERRMDIPLLVEYFAHRFAKRAGKSIRHIDKKTLSLLQSYDWPGNIRELQNVVERAVIVCDLDTLSVDERWLSGPWARSRASTAPHTRAMAPREKDAIEAALIDSRGRVAGPFGAALRLGLPPSTLESKIRALNIEKSRFRRE